MTGFIVCICAIVVELSTGVEEEFDELLAFVEFVAFVVFVEFKSEVLVLLLLAVFAIKKWSEKIKIGKKRKIFIFKNNY